MTPNVSVYAEHAFACPASGTTAGNAAIRTTQAGSIARWRSAQNMNRKGMVRMSQQKKTRPGTVATVQSASDQVHLDFTLTEAERQALAVENIIRQLREREIAGGGGWTGSVSEPPRTRYPNLAAEILAARYFLCHPAGAAGITEELLTDVLEAGADLRWEESVRLANLFRCKMGYLFASTLQIVDTTRRKGWLRAIEICEAVDAFHRDFDLKELPQDLFYQNLVRRADCTAWRFVNGQLVTYAEYRHALNDLRYVRCKLSRPAPRGREAQTYESA